MNVTRRSFLTMLSHVPVLAWMFGKPKEHKWESVVDDTVRYHHAGFACPHTDEDTYPSDERYCFSGRWISVDERLPELDGGCDISFGVVDVRYSKRVLMYQCGCVLEGRLYRSGEDAYWLSTGLDDKQVWRIRETGTHVTHWAELPKPPRSEPMPVIGKLMIGDEHVADITEFSSVEIDKAGKSYTVTAKYS